MKENVNRGENMKKILALLMVSVMTLTLTGCGTSESDSNKKKIGVIQLAEHPALDATREGFMDALAEEGLNEDTVDFDYKNASNDQSNTETIADKMVNDGNDLIFAIATPTAQAVAQKTQEIPVVISAVTDPESSGLVKSNKKPGGNVTGTSDLTPVEQQFDLLKQILPEAKKVAIMYCSSEDNSIFQAKMAEKAAKANGLKYVKASVADSNQIQQVAESLIGKVDAIYIPTDNLLAEGMATVAQVANENHLPCIVGEEGMVKNGGLATYGLDYYKLGYRTGLQAAKILKGEAEPATMAIEYLPAEECELTINQSVADKLNIKIPADLLAKAKVIK